MSSEEKNFFGDHDSHYGDGQEYEKKFEKKFEREFEQDSFGHGEDRREDSGWGRPCGERGQRGKCPCDGKECDCGSFEFKPRFRCRCKCVCVFERDFKEPKMKRTRCSDIPDCCRWPRSCGCRMCECCCSHKWGCGCENKRECDCGCK